MLQRFTFDCWSLERLFAGPGTHGFVMVCALKMGDTCQDTPKMATGTGGTLFSNINQKSVWSQSKHVKTIESQWVSRMQTKCEVAKSCSAVYSKAQGQSYSDAEGQRCCFNTSHVVLATGHQLWRLEPFTKHHWNSIAFNYTHYTFEPPHEVRWSRCRKQWYYRNEVVAICSHVFGMSLVCLWRVTHGKWPWHFLCPRALSASHRCKIPWALQMDRRVHLSHRVWLLAQCWSWCVDHLPRIPLCLDSQTTNRTAATPCVQHVPNLACLDKDAKVRIV